MLSPLALGWVFFYSYTKRFTRWCHLVLGVGHVDRAGGRISRGDGRWSNPWWMLVALALAVATWGGGFDVLYALQDIEFDRSQRLHSLPVGARRARARCVIARVLHIVTVALSRRWSASATFAGTHARLVLRASASSSRRRCSSTSIRS